MRIWDPFLTVNDKAVYAATGYGKRGGFGARPAVIVVDVNYFFTGDRALPILESVAVWRNSCGAAGWAAIAPTQRLLAAARQTRVPVFFTTGAPGREDGFDRGAWAFKNRRADEDLPAHRHPSIDGNAIVADIAPEPHEFVIAKIKPSGFHGTPLLGYLVELGIDTLIVTGTTTSGCVRATVIDAFSQNYHVSVVEECCFDRFESSHAINLFDMNAKYADVVGVAETCDYLRALPHGLFDDKIAFPKQPAQG